MMRFYIADEEGNFMLLMGLTRRNIEKLTDNQPIVANLEKAIDRICIVFGEDKIAILDELKKSGAPIEEWMYEAVGEDKL